MIPLPVAADQPASDEPVVRISAKPLERRAPRYPSQEALQGSTGWVLLDFVVREDGSVADPIVQESSGLRAFERAALRAVRRWSFEPATVDGEPVEQCHTQVAISFDGDVKNLGATRSFKRRYGEVVDHWQAGRFAERFGLEVAQLQYATALQTWERLEELDERIELPAGIEQAQRDIPALRDSDLEFSVDATIPPPRDEEPHGVWQYRLLRHMPGLRGIEGELNRVELRCQWKRVTAQPGEGKAWRIPQDWGACDVFVFGEPGARFKLVEYPAGTRGDHESTEG